MQGALKPATRPHSLRRPSLRAGLCRRRLLEDLSNACNAPMELPEELLSFE